MSNHDDPPQDVGESMTRSGEDVSDDVGKEAGREDTGEQGATRRPKGESTPRDSTGVGGQEPIDEESPYLPPP